MNNSLIPIINIAPIIKNNFQSKKSKKVLREIEKACVNIGFFQITGHGISKQNIQNIIDLMSFPIFPRKRIFIESRSRAGVTAQFFGLIV